MNVSIPSFDCYVRADYLYNGDKTRARDAVKARAFGIASLQGRALGFHVMDSLGAVTWRLPISALVSEAGMLEGTAANDDNKRGPWSRHWFDGRTPHVALPLDHLQLWDCFSYDVTITEFDHLSGRACQVLLKDGARRDALYMFTVDWHGNEYAEGAGDSGHKCAHILELDCGCYAAQPNNRILWADPATIAKPFAVVPDYKTNARIWRVEGTSKWSTPDTDLAFPGPSAASRAFPAALARDIIEKHLHKTGAAGPKKRRRR